MRIKKVVKRLVALGAGATMLGATVMGAMAADLSSYPNSFQTDGVFNGLFVVGESAKPIDNLAMTDIATAMWYKKASTSKTTTVSGDAWKAATSAKSLEMANSNAAASAITGEQMYNMLTYLSKDELKALADGNYKTGESTYTYSQYLYLDNTNQNTNEIVKYAEDDYDVTADFLFVDSGKNIGLYKLEFSSNAESDIYTTAGSASTSGPVLQDFEDTKITLMGKEYTIVLARRPQATPEDSVKLTLMGGAVSGALKEGEEKTYKVAGKSYKTKLVFTDSDEAKFTVNGESTDKLQVGDTYKLSDGNEVGVSEILYQDYAGGVHSADFFIGASKIVLRDNDITNTASDTEVDVGGETVDGADVIITGTDDNTTFRMATIEVNMTAQDDYYVGAGKKLSDTIKTVGDEKEIIFTNNWDIEYKGLTTEDVHDIKLDSTTDRKYKLVWYDGDGNKVDMPLAYAASSTTVQLSEDSSEKYVSFDENDYLAKNDYLVLTGGDSASGSAKSFALQYKGADKSSATSPKIKFKNLGSGKTLEYSVNTGTSDTVATVKVGGYSFDVENTSVKTSKDFTIRIDRDADGTIVATNMSTIIGIVDYYGANITVSSNTTGNLTRGLIYDTINLSITTDNANDYDDQAPSTLDLQIGATTTNEVTLDSLSVGGTSNPLLTPEGEENIAYGYTTMGAKITYETPSSSPNLVTYNYPKNQKLPQVYVTSGATTTTTAAGGDLALVQVVDATKLDSEVKSTGAQNMVVVGGPCVNSVAAKLMGNPKVCTTGFSPGKAVVKMYEDATTKKMAMLVAGYSGKDTRLAGKVIAHRYSELKGTELEVSGTTYSDATLGKPTVVKAAATTTKAATTK